MKQNDINKTEVGQRIKNIRLSKGMTLEEFGKIFNATKGNVLKWEKGQSLPNPERLKAIAKIADMTVEELLYGNKLEYAVSLCNHLLDKNLIPAAYKQIFIENYSHQLIDEIRDKLSSVDLPVYSYNEIDELVISKFNELQNTPTNSKKLINSVISLNQNEIQKIYKYISISTSIKNDDFDNLFDLSMEEFDEEIAEKVINILDNTILELRELLKEAK